MAGYGWVVYALGAMLFFSAANVVLKKTLDSGGLKGLEWGTVVPLVAIAVFAAVAVYLVGFGHFNISINTLQLVALFIVLSAGGFALMLKAFGDGKAAVVTAVLSMSTVGVAVLSMVFLGDSFSQKELLAMALAVASIIVLVV